MKRAIKAGYKVFLGTIHYLYSLAAIVETIEFQRAVKLLVKRRKHVFVTGMGKAGFIGRKMASTLSSNSIPASFIHSGEAMHGDLGAVSPGDVLVAFSNSGKTLEVIQVVERAVDLGVKVILITGHGDKLAKKADVVLLYGEIKEACCLDLTPTTSIAVMLAISDALSMGVQAIRGLTPEQYVKNHHHGYLNRKARLKCGRSCGDLGRSTRHFLS